MDFHEAYTDTCSTVGMAARLGNFEALKRLIKQGKPSDVKDNRGWFPIHEAAHAGHTHCLKLLLKQEAVDINWKSFEGETALLLACRKGHETCAQELINRRANVDLSTNELISPLHETCKNGDIDCARLLLEAGCDANSQDFRGDTPLHTAEECNYTYMVELLLEYNADVCSYSENELTPVFTAALEGHVECLKLMLEKAKQQGKEYVVNMTAKDNASPLLIACQHGYDDCVKMLLEHGADPGLQVLVQYGEKEQLYMDALQYAVKGNHKRCLALLLQCQRRYPRFYKPNELHPLMLATRHTSIDCLKLLMENGFDAKQAFYENDRRSHGSILCFFPSLEAARYILEQESDLEKLFKPPKPYRVDSKTLDVVKKSFHNVRLLNLILRYISNLDEAIWWDKNMLRDRNTYLELQTETCYLLIRYGCRMSELLKSIQSFILRILPEHLWCYNLILGMLMLLTPNLQIPVDNMDWHHVLQRGPMTTQLSQLVIDDSHTLKYACRTVIVGHMIRADQWDREGLVKLGVPELIQDYLLFLEYGEFGHSFRKLVEEGKNFIKAEARCQSDNFKSSCSDGRLFSIHNS